MIKTIILLISALLAGPYVEQLDSDCYWERNRAQAKLENLGQIAIPYLQRYKTNIPETRTRVINIIEHRLNFNIPFMPRCDAIIPYKFVYDQSYARTWIGRFRYRYEAMAVPTNVSAYYADEVNVTTLMIGDAQWFLPNSLIENILKAGCELDDVTKTKLKNK